MKLHRAWPLILLAALVPLPFAAAQTPSQQTIPAEQLGLIPEPASVQAFAATYSLPQKVRISASGDGAENVAGFLEQFLKERGIQARVVSQGEAAIRLSVGGSDPAIGSEGYHLAVNNAGVNISANQPAGLFYGVDTLEQLFPADPKAGNQVHQVTITDQPRFSWRAVMLDSARHYFPPSFIKQLIDAAAFYKLNTFHWHLVDDQGWRIEIKKYPRLTSVGSCGDYDHPLGTGPCQFYTQKEIRDIVEYAQKRYVTIVPEIEIPGHSAAAVYAYPELACKPISDSVYCPSEQTFTFLENVLTEVMKLFPSPYIHSGGDEVSPKAWDASPVAQAVMKQNNLPDAHALQGWIDRRIEAFLEQHGRRMVGWDEILAGNVSTKAIIMSWRGPNGGIAGAVKGNDVVMAPWEWMYVNGYQGPEAWEPKANGNMLTLQHMYSYGPDLGSLSPAETSRVLGVEACLWSEWVSTPALAWYRLFPRVLALSEMGWTPSKQRDWTSFQKRTVNQYPRLEARKIPFFIPGPMELVDTVTDQAHLPITLTSPVPGATMYYTLDGSYPTKSSTEYRAPFTINLAPGGEQRVRVLTVLADGRASAPSEATYTRKAAHVSGPQ